MGQACAPQAEKKGHYLKPSISRELMRHAWMISTVNACLRAWYKVPFHKDLKVFSCLCSQTCLTLQLALLSRSAFPKIQSYIYAALLMHKVEHPYCFFRGKIFLTENYLKWTREFIFLVKNAILRIGLVKSQEIDAWIMTWANYYD